MMATPAAMFRRLSQAVPLSTVASKLVYELLLDNVLDRTPVLPVELHDAIMHNLAAFAQLDAGEVTSKTIAAAAYAATCLVATAPRDAELYRSEATLACAARRGLYALLQVAASPPRRYIIVSGSPTVRESGACPAESACQALANLLVGANAKLRAEVFAHASRSLSAIVADREIWARSQRGACRVISSILVDPACQATLQGQEGSECARAFAVPLMHCVVNSVGAPPSSKCEDGWDRCFSVGTGAGRLAKALCALRDVMRGDPRSVSGWHTSEQFLPMLRAVQKQLLLGLRPADPVESFAKRREVQEAIVEARLLATLRANQHEAASAAASVVGALSESEAGWKAAGEMGLKLLMLSVQQPFSDCPAMTYGFAFPDGSGSGETSPAAYGFEALNELNTKAMDNGWVPFVECFVKAGGLRAIESGLLSTSQGIQARAANLVGNLGFASKKLYVQHGLPSPLRLDEAPGVLRPLVALLSERESQKMLASVLHALHAFAESSDSKQRCAKAGAVEACLRLVVHLVQAPHVPAPAGEPRRSALVGTSELLRGAILLLQDLSYVCLGSKRAARVLEVPGGLEALVVCIADDYARWLVGKRVQVHGVVAKPELNGQLGKALSFASAGLKGGRVAVRMDTGVDLSFKPANLFLSVGPVAAAGQQPEKQSICRSGFIALAELGCDQSCATRIVKAPGDVIAIAALMCAAHAGQPTEDEDTDGQVADVAGGFLGNVAEAEGGAVAKRLGVHRELIEALVRGLEAVPHPDRQLFILSSIAMESRHHTEDGEVERLVSLWEQCGVFCALARLLGSPYLLSDAQGDGRQPVERLRYHALVIAELAFNSRDANAMAHLHKGDVLRAFLELRQEQSAAQLVVSLRVLVASSALLREARESIASSTDGTGTVSKDTRAAALSAMRGQMEHLTTAVAGNRSAADSLALGNHAPSIPVHTFSGKMALDEGLEALRNAPSDSNRRLWRCANPACPTAALDQGVVQLQKCACGVVSYCGKACQLADYKIHKRTCSFKAQQRAAKPKATSKDVDID